MNPERKPHPDIHVSLTERQQSIWSRTTNHKDLKSLATLPEKIERRRRQKKVALSAAAVAGLLAIAAGSGVVGGRLFGSDDGPVQPIRARVEVLDTVPSPTVLPQPGTTTIPRPSSS